MNERDFDKLFKDKIGDELPFDFQPAEWQNVSRALEDALPTTSLPSPETAAMTSIKNVGWWAAAAATALVVSNLWLIYQWRETKIEIAALQNKRVEDYAAAQKLVVVHDTIYQTIYRNAPELVQKSRSQEAAVNPNNTSQKTIKKNELNIYNNDNQSIVEKLSSQNPFLATQKDIVQQSNDIAKSKYMKSQNPKNEDKNKAPTPPQYPLDAQTDAAQNDTPSQMVFATVAEKYAYLNQQSIIQNEKSEINNILKNNELSILDINRLKELFYTNERIPYSELAENSKIAPIKPLKKATLPLFSDWAIGVQRNWTLDDKSRRKMARADWNVGITFSTDIKRDWRAMISVDYWNEVMNLLDSIDRHDVPAPPSPDYRFDFAELESPLVQLRVGLDYLLPRMGSNNFFVGLGVGKQWLLKPEEKYTFKARTSPNPNPNPNPNPQFMEVKQSSDNKQMKNFAIIRIGTEGSFYRGLGWSANLSSQWTLNNWKDQSFNAQAGIVYRF